MSNPWLPRNDSDTSAGTRFAHSDSPFSDHVIDWDLIETYWLDLLRTAIPIRDSRLALVTLLRFLVDAQLGEQITTKAEAFHGFSAWPHFGDAAIG